MTDWKKRLLDAGALWLHDGNSSTPHALLTSGKHSDGFINTGMITCRPEILAEILSDDSPYIDGLPSPDEVDWVIGSALGAITWAYALAGRLSAKAGFTEKDGENMTLKRFSLSNGDRVLVCEDVVTTGGSTLKTLAALRKTGCILLPQIALIVNRSSSEKLGDFRLHALLTLQISTFEPEDCPLCEAGSEALRPKQNWEKLTGRGI